MALGNLKDLTKLVKHDRVNLCRIHSVFLLLGVVSR